MRAGKKEHQGSIKARIAPIVIEKLVVEVTLSYHVHVIAAIFLEYLPTSDPVHAIFSQASYSDDEHRAVLETTTKKG